MLADRDHVAHQGRTVKMVLRDMMVQMEIREKQVQMDRKVAVTIVHLPELLQATKQLQWIVQEKNDVKLEQSIIHTISIHSSIIFTAFNYFCFCIIFPSVITAKF